MLFCFLNKSYNLLLNIKAMFELHLNGFAMNEIIELVKSPRKKDVCFKLIVEEIPKWVIFYYFWYRIHQLYASRISNFVFA